MKKSFIVLLFLLSLYANAQKFELNCGGLSNETGYSITPEVYNEGGWVLSGVSNTANDTNMYFVRINQYGDTMWTKRYQFLYSNAAYSIVDYQQPYKKSNRYMAVGYLSNGFDKDAMWVVLDENFDTIMYPFIYDNENGDDELFFAVNPIFSVIDAVGYVTNSAGNKDAFVIRNDDGAEIFNKKFGGIGDEVLYAHAEYENYGILTGYSTSSPESNKDVYIVGFDWSNQDTVFTKTIGGESDDIAYSVAFNSKNFQYLIAGSTQSFGAGGKDIYLILLNESGDTIWTKTYGDTGDEEALSCVYSDKVFGPPIQNKKTQNISAYYIVTGYTTSKGNGQKDVFVMAIDATDGSIVYERIYGGTNNDVGNCINVNYCSYLIAGSTNSFENNQQAYIIKDNKIEINISKTNPTCHDADNGYAVITYTGSNNNFDYYWSNEQNSSTITEVVAGKYYVTISGYDCYIIDSVELDNPPMLIDTIYPNICYGDTFKIGTNIKYTVSGVYKDTLQSVSLCDSIVITYLTVNPIYNDTLVASICSNTGGIKIGNHIYNTTGIYIDTLKTYAGCDSIKTLILNVRQAFHDTTIAQICSGEVYYFGGREYITTGIYHDSLQTVSGCDSIKTLILKVNDVSSKIFKGNYCIGDTIFFAGKFIYETGVYCDSLTNRYGCDSVVILNAVFHVPPVITATVTNASCSADNGTIMIMVNGSNAPFSYIWNDGVTTKDRSLLSQGTYKLIVNDTINCQDSLEVTITKSPFSSIHGILTVLGDSIPNDSAQVILFTINDSNIVTATSSVKLNNMNFAFNNLIEGKYLIKVELDKNLNRNELWNTYYDSTYIWNNATMINLPCDSNAAIVVKMIQIPKPISGTGVISGTITYDYVGGKSKGGPIPGAEIFIEQRPNDKPIMYTETDSSGFYKFDKVPEGNYKINVDIPGFPVISTYLNISISGNDTVKQQLNFIVDTSSENRGIYADTSSLTTNLTIPNNSISYIHTYPNPINDILLIDINNTTLNPIYIQLCDISGRVVYNDRIPKNNNLISKNTLAINMTQFKTGVYLLQIGLDNTIYLRKIIKE